MNLLVGTVIKLIKIKLFRLNKKKTLLIVIINYNIIIYE